MLPAKPINRIVMKSYNDLLKQIRRIDVLWSARNYDEHLDGLYFRAIKTFYLYKRNMQLSLARFNDVGREVKNGHYWAAVWDRNRDTKLPRSIYAGY